MTELKLTKEKGPPEDAIRPHFTPWPDYRDGFFVVEVHDWRPVAGPFRTPHEALAEAERRNGQVSERTAHKGAAACC